ncbi:MAG: hypothetical protein K2P81_11400 [Bacteriovoracaceae bacterium]|nr:hypothetical protein [Bacteriovoracaceae bacterium]
MNCKSCLHNIEDAIKGFDPKSTIPGDVVEKTVTVQSQQDIEKIRNIIVDAGYAAEKAKEE